MSPQYAFKEILLYRSTAHSLSAAVLAPLYQYTVIRDIQYIWIRVTLTGHLFTVTKVHYKPHSKNLVKQRLITDLSYLLC